MMKLLYLFSITVLLSATVATSLYIRPSQILQNGNNQFTAKLFSEIVNKNQNKSVVISAFSLLTPLILLGSASEGPTHDEILNALGLPDDDAKNSVFSLIHNKMSSLKWLPEYIKGVQLKQANRFFIPLSYEIDNNFATSSKYIYESEAAKVNFADKEKSANDINTWVEEETKHYIKDIINPNSLSSDTQGLFVNAVYFKGSWKYPFDKSATLNQDFYVNKQDKIQIPFMHITEEYQYKQSDKLKSKILALPHVGEQATLIIVLPNDLEGIKELIEDLKSPNILDEETKIMSSSRVQVSIPKFKIETVINLKEFLQRINITTMFTDESMLIRILKNNKKLSISDAVQKVLIEINEEGNDAAIVDAFIKAETTPNHSIPTSQFEFIADHPFVFFLKANNDTILNGVFYGP